MKQPILPIGSAQNSRRKGPTCIIASIGILLLVGFTFYNPKHRPHFEDFSVYYEAAIKAGNHHTLYDVEGFFQFKYAPIVGTLFSMVLPLFPFQTAAHVNYLLSLLLWVAILFLIRPVKLKWLPILLCVFAYIVPLRDELKLGQINAVSILLLIVSYRLSHRGRISEIGAGQLLALAVCFKLYSLFIVPILVFQKKWVLLISCVFGFLFLNIGMVALIHGFSFALLENRLWLESLTGSTTDLIAWVDNISLLGVLSRWLASSFLIQVIWLLTLILCLFIQYRWVLVGKDRQGVALALASITVLNPLVWPNWILFTMPIFFILLEEIETLPNRNLLYANLLLFSLVSWFGNVPWVKPTLLPLAIYLLIGTFLSTQDSGPCDTAPFRIIK